MTKRPNLKHKFGQGITPQQFMSGMKVRVMELSNIPNTKEAFLKTYQDFSWKSKNDESFFNNLSSIKGLRCFILCTDWCPDVIWNVPVLLRVLEQSQIPTEILVMDDHLETMDLFLTNGGRAQPIAVILHENGDVLGRWGARPQYIQHVMDDFKKNNPNSKETHYQENLNKVYQKIGKLYHFDTEYQDVILQELQDLFSSIESSYYVEKGKN